MSPASFALRLAALGAAVLIVTVPLSAQRGGGAGMPRYDKSTETTISGTVMDVQVHQGMGRQTGVHLMLQTASDMKEVHVAPTAWLEEHHLTFAKGDTLTVVGSDVTVDGKPAFLARTITRGETTVTVRNEQGIPDWAGARGRRQR